ncbi:hypothetical protein WN48_08941 [Eufriesea mexicana]|uniref:Uncharacterized protein n=1 Tax=Eufriesea mexicana TaxID=516756 RepID=A0A310SIY5_9HYME|nr:hypothetical protein WN48_08941 [Eufriesea mexicana]
MFATILNHYLIINSSRTELMNLTNDDTMMNLQLQISKKLLSSDPHNHIASPSEKLNLSFCKI